MWSKQVISRCLSKTSSSCLSIRPLSMAINAETSAAPSIIKQERDEGLLSDLVNSVRALVTRSPPNSNVLNRLPQTFSEALAVKDAAVVVTTKNNEHKIVHVNSAWEALCGYKKEDVLFQSLKLIQGPDSNRILADETIRLVEETKQPQDAYLINYTKDGRRFINHLSVGPMRLSEDDSEVQFLVGILEEVEPSQVPLRMVNV